MPETTVGREVIQIVELRQPRCARVYGTAPCTATGAGDEKCFNTRVTCQVPAAFSLGTPLSLFFSRGGVADKVPGVPYIIPSLVSVSTAPTQINLAGSNLDRQGLGSRAVCNITFMDHAHSDRVVDPYKEERSWDALSGARGSFWTRWRARNQYRQNVVINVYEGYAGQTLGEMVKRTYFLQSISPPNASGQVTLTGKDILSRLEERKAQIPIASPGRRPAPLTTASFSDLTATNCVIADYPSSGYLRIDKECFYYSGRNQFNANTVQFTGVQRAVLGTVAATHDTDAVVQSVYRFTGQTVADAYRNVLRDYGNIPESWMDYANWVIEGSTYLTGYQLYGYITEPTSVSQIISEISIQTLSYLWWDERAALIKMKAVRGADVLPPLLTEELNIVEDSFSLQEMPRERASQVWIYYGQRTPVEGAEDAKNYKQLAINANLESETDELYGEPSIRKIFARFLTSTAIIDSVASKTITRYVDIPHACEFMLDAKDRQYWVGDSVRISHHLDVKPDGTRLVRTWLITSAEEVVPGELVHYRAEDTSLYGLIYYVMANGAADYPGPGLGPEKHCYIGNNQGLLSDGTPCGRIS